MDTWGKPDTEKEVALKKQQHFFEKYASIIKLGEKVVPDLLESIMKPTDPAKE